MKEIIRHDVTKGHARVVIHNHVAYFTDHVARRDLGFTTVKDQTAAILRRFDELFERFGMRKENILLMTAYLRDIGKLSEFDESWIAWIGDKDVPAAIAVQAPPAEDYLVAISVNVAVD